MQLFILSPNNMECFSIESCVKGYIYKEIWKVNVEEQIPCQCENGSCADYFVQAVVFWSKWEVLALLFWLCLSLVLCSLTHTRQLNQEDTICGFRHCQWEAGSETQPYLSSSSMWKRLWLENFMTPGLVTKISTPQKQPTIQYVVAVYTAT